jgi:hypothetical protein
MIGNVTVLLSVLGCCKGECKFLSLFVGVIRKKKIKATKLDSIFRVALSQKHMKLLKPYNANSLHKTDQFGLHSDSHKLLCAYIPMRVFFGNES